MTLFQNAEPILTLAIVLVNIWRGVGEENYAPMNINESIFSFFEGDPPDYLCTPLNECKTHRNKKSDNLLDSNCECGKSCIRHDTCCFDSPYRDRMKINRYHKKCTRVIHSELYVFKKGRCKRGWNGNRIIQELCESDPNTSKDPTEFLPVTSSITQVTYKNYFCAVCHNDYEHSVHWEISIVFPFKSIRDAFFKSEYVNRWSINDLVYSADTKSWGIIDLDKDDQVEFKPVFIKISIPKELTSIVKFCYPHLISSCHPTWRDVPTAKKCEEYMDVVAVNLNGVHSESKQRYRNMHCALCNYAKNFKAYNCFKSLRGLSGPIDLGNTAPDYFGIPFYRLLDVNKADGNKVREYKSKPKCNKNEVYDVHFEKCRRLSCSQTGFVIKNGQCVKG